MTKSRGRGSYGGSERFGGGEQQHGDRQRQPQQQYRGSGRGSYSRAEQEQPERFGRSEQHGDWQQHRQGRGGGRGSFAEQSWRGDQGSRRQPHQTQRKATYGDSGQEHYGRPRETSHEAGYERQHERRGYHQQPHAAGYSQGVRSKEHRPTDTQKLTSNMSKLTLYRKSGADESDDGFAPRPGFSTIAVKKIRVITNMFRLQHGGDDIYHYDIDIMSMRKVRATPKDDAKPLPKSLCHAIILSWYQQNRFIEYSPVFDGGKNLYTCKKLPFEEQKEFRVTLQNDRGRSEEFAVTVKPVKKKKSKGGKTVMDNIVNVNSIMAYVSGKTQEMPHEARMVLEAILAYRTQNSLQMVLGNSFFMKNDSDAKSDLSLGVEMWTGYSQNIRFTSTGPAIVINTAAAVFHKEVKITDRVREIIRGTLESQQNMQSKDIQNLSRNLKGLSVVVSHQKNKRKYRIDGVSDKSAAQLTFPLDNGEEVTVQKYFERQYNCRLRYPKLPLLKMTSSKNPVYMPMEVCEVAPNQRIKGKLAEKLAGNMIKKTALSPKDKFKIIEHSAHTMNEMSKKQMTDYGIRVNLQPIETDARVLRQPKIKYQNREIVIRENGVWDMRENYFRSSQKIKNPLLVCFAYCNDKCLEKYRNLMHTAGKNVGLFFENTITTLSVGGRTRTTDAFEEAMRQKSELILFVIDKNDLDHPYEEIKFLADIEYKIMTQCVTQKVIERMDMRIATNICLKINTKMGGVNHEICGWPLVLKREGVIIMGADVIHHVKDDFPSIAALVACVDESVAQYTHCCRALKNPKERKSQEIILDLEVMTKNVLKQYYRRNGGRKPNRILFYRDGVSEGQFLEAFEKEIPMIKKACSLLENDYMPPVTYIIVQKRHPVRIRPENEERDGVGKGKNIPPGTIVDKDIVDPQLYDFYLCSHEGIQGTSKPTRYTVLMDENRLTPESMECMTFNLCHLDARCNRSISIPTPVKYADLLCTRASEYVSHLMKQRKPDLANKIDMTMKRMTEMQLQMFFV